MFLSTEPKGSICIEPASPRGKVLVEVFDSNLFFLGVSYYDLGAVLGDASQPATKQFNFTDMRSVVEDHKSFECGNNEKFHAGVCQLFSYSKYDKDSISARTAVGHTSLFLL